MSNKELPSETWIHILQCLSNSNLKECRLVKRSWNLMVQGIYANCVVLHVKLDRREQTRELLSTLTNYPELVPKIRIITMLYERLEIESGMPLYNLDPWMLAMKKCTSLLVLNIYVENPYHYLKDLHRMAKLPVLEEIKLLPNNHYSPACHRTLHKCRMKHTGQQYGNDDRFYQT